MDVEKLKARLISLNDDKNNEKLLKSTEISSEYLTPEDLKKLRTGIEVYTKKELNKTIEDFE